MGWTFRGREDRKQELFALELVVWASSVADTVTRNARISQDQPSLARFRCSTRRQMLQSGGTRTSLGIPGESSSNNGNCKVLTDDLYASIASIPAARSSLVNLIDEELPASPSGALLEALEPDALVDPGRDSGLLLSLMVDGWKYSSWTSHTLRRSSSCCQWN